MGLVLLLAPITTAHAAGEPAPGAATSTTVKLPDGPGSVRGLADAADVNIFSAQLGYSIPIELPKGRAGLTPSLGLHYSGDLGNGPLGVGWTLPTASIRRSTRHGVPRYTDDDEFELVGIAGGGRLVKLVDESWALEGRSRQVKVERLESGKFLVTENGGVKYHLGTSAASQQGGGPRIFSWLLDRVEHPTGETITYEYLHDDGEAYLKRITWGPNGVYKVELEHEQRPDPAISFRSGFKVKTARRVQHIKVVSHAETQRLYALTYGDTLVEDGLFGLSRLRSVRMFGRNEVGSLPPLTFDYALPQAPAVQQATGVDGWVLNDDGVSLVDVDGDGNVDLLHLGMEEDFFKRGRQGSFDPKEPVGGGAQAWLADARLLDVDGDTRPELVRSFNETLQISKLENATFGPPTPWPGAEGLPLFRPNVTFADLNADGFIDYVWGGSEGMSVHFGSPDGLGPAVDVPPIDGISLQPGPNARFHDVNGDGLVDVVHLAGGWWQVFHGRGDGTFDFGGEHTYPWGDSTSLQDLRLGDLNRDGLMDIVHIQSGYIRWYRGLAGGGVEPTYREVPRPGDDGFPTVITLADVNGNGSEDVIWSNVTGMWILDIAGPTSAGMLVGIHNGMGKSLTVEYASSAALSHAAETDEPWARLLPMAIPVPVAMEVLPGGGAPARRVEYSVRDGFWDVEERRLGGFLRSTTTTIGDGLEDTLVEETWYHAGEEKRRQLRGRPYRSLQRDAVGKLFKESETEWDVQSIDGLDADDDKDDWLLFAPVVLSEKVLHHEGHEEPLETFVTYEYDGRARPIAENRFGRLDLLTDQVAIRRHYTHDDSLWVHDLVCEESVYSADQAQNSSGEYELVPASDASSQQRHHYGDKDKPLEWEDVADCIPGRGLLRETLGRLDEANGFRWMSLVKKEYDQFDNPIVVVEGGVERELAYTADGLFAESETLRPTPSRSLIWSVTEWDKALGVPTEISEPSGALFQLSYDSLGRTTAVAVNNQDPHVRYTYDWEDPGTGSNWLPRTWTWSFDGDPEDLAGSWGPNGPMPGLRWRETMAAANGAGEPVYTSVRLDTSKWLVSGHRHYDRRGLVTDVADGYETSTLGPSAPASAPRQVLVHDALGRLLSQTLPTLDAKTLSYSAFEVTSTTQGLAPVVTRTDGLDRIIRTQRVVNGDAESVDASYDPLGRITALGINNGAVTHSFTYDTLGRLVAATDPDIGDRTLEYNDQGWLIEHTNGANQSRTFVYDDIGRLTQTLGDGGSYTYHYDVAAPTRPGTYLGSRLAWVSEPRGEVHLSYDAFGREIRQERRIDSEWAEELVHLSPSGLALYREMDGLQVPYSYDAAGRLIAIDDYWQATSLDASGRILSETYRNGLVQTYWRDALGLPATITVSGSAGDLYNVSAGRNPWGAPIWVQDHDSAGLNHSATFTYDGAARLTQAVIGAKGQAPNLGTDANSYIFNQQYDALQNMTSRTVTPAGANIDALWGTYTYGSGSHGPRQLSSVGSTELEYDAAGRVISIGDGTSDRLLTYNGLDQLVTASIPDPTGGTARVVQHSYGYDGLRTVTEEGGGLARLWFTSNLVHEGGKRQWYLKDGARTIVRLNLDPVPEQSAAHGAGVGSSNRALASLTRSFGGLLASASLLLGLFIVVVAVRARTRPGAALGVALVVSALFATACRTPVESGPEVTASPSALWQINEAIYFHGGLSAGPQLLTREDGSVFEERRYEPFGAPIDAYSEPANGGPASYDAVNFAAEPLNILNKETEPVSGFSYHGARWMAPHTGMWLTPDPPVKAPDPKFLYAPWALHPYQYVLQNPLLYWDPNGHAEESSGDLKEVAETRKYLGKAFHEGFRDKIAPVARPIITLHPAFALSEAISGKAVATGESIYALERVELAAGAGLGFFSKAFRVLPFGRLFAKAPLRFSQISASPRFSKEGKFAGKTISQVAEMLRSGDLQASELPIEIIKRGNARLIVNTRSSLALKQANIAEDKWTLIDKTGDTAAEARMTARLEYNGLTDEGSEELYITGSGYGKAASTYYSE